MFILLAAQEDMDDRIVEQKCRYDMASDQELARSGDYVTMGVLALPVNPNTR